MRASSLLISGRDGIARALDAAILYELGKIPVPLPSAVSFDRIDPEEFWRQSRIHDPAPVGVVREVGLRDHGRVRMVDLEGPSSGPGVHPGSRKLIARAHIRTDLPNAPTVILLHGFAIPNPLWEGWQCRILTARGVNAIRLDHPFHLRRRARGMLSGEGYLSAEPRGVCRAMRQSAEDAAALVSWARANLGSSVSVLGVSLGGGTACQLAALTELSSMVAIAPFCDPAATLTERLPRQLRRGFGVAGESYGFWGNDLPSAQAAMSDALAPIVARNLGTPRTPASRIALVKPTLDRIVGPDPITELGRAWGCEPWEMRDGHISVMNAPGLMRRVYSFLLDGNDGVAVDAAAEVRLAG